MRASGPSSQALELLKKFKSVKKIHPAQDFVDGKLLFGIPIEHELLLLTSDRELIQEYQLPGGAQVDNRKFDLCRFSKEGITSFLNGADVPGYTLLSDLECFVDRFLVFRDTRISLLVAAWTMGTYCYRVFQTFPYMVLRSPMKRCGKSRVLDLLSLLAFNATPITTNPTEAQLFRGPAKNGGALLLDEVESLRGNKEAYAGLLQVLNAGFQQGGVVQRLEKVADKFETIDFPTYCPRALAGISRLAETLEDRSIVIFMTRKLKTEKVERFSRRRLETEAQQLRDRCYTWVLTHAKELERVYEEGNFPELGALDDRAQDLWEPLLSIARICDEEAKEVGEPGGLVSTFSALAADLCHVRDEGDTTTVRLLETLKEIIEEMKTRLFTPSELLILLKVKPGFDWVSSAYALARLLNPLGLLAHQAKIPWGEKRKSVRQYALDKATLDDLLSRYGGGEN